MSWLSGSLSRVGGALRSLATVGGVAVAVGVGSAAMAAEAPAIGRRVVLVVFDPKQISADALLKVFWESHDPTQGMKQGNDVGTEYRSGIYFTTPQQQVVAQEVIAEMAGSGVYSRPIVTEVLPLQNYWPAEDYHQDFFARNPQQGYCMAVAAPKVAKFRKTFAR
ncbi:MAG: peptide-methionine (S)-S-oxide reductase MsrA, partial [Verrucomicrobiota bacterium]